MTANRVPSFAADCALGLVSYALGAGRIGVGMAVRVGGPVTAVAAAPLRRVLRPLAEHGRGERAASLDRLDAFVEAVAPGVVDAVLDRLDVTDLVLRHVDLERLASALPYDDIVEQVDVDRIIAGIDVDGVVARLDLDGLLRRVDLDVLLGSVDLDAVVAHVDLDAALSRLDLTGIVRGVLDELDLPEIIRESTGAMTSETVRSVRMQGIDADARVSHLVDRLLLRRGERRTDAVPDGDVTTPPVTPSLPGQRHDEPQPDQR